MSTPGPGGWLPPRPGPRPSSGRGRAGALSSEPERACCSRKGGGARRGHVARRSPAGFVELLGVEERPHALKQRAGQVLATQCRAPHHLPARTEGPRGTRTRGRRPEEGGGVVCLVYRLTRQERGSIPTHTHYTRTCRHRLHNQSALFSKACFQSRVNANCQATAADATAVACAKKWGRTTHRGRLETG